MAVLAGHRDVAQDDVGGVAQDSHAGGLRGLRSIDRGPGSLEQHRQGLAPAAIVIDDEDAMPRARARA